MAEAEQVPEEPEYTLTDRTQPEGGERIIQSEIDREEEPEQSVAEIIEGPRLSLVEPGDQGEIFEEPERPAVGDVVAPASTVEAGIDDLLEPDPFEARFGFDSQTAAEMFNGLPDGLQPATAEELVEALEAAGVHSAAEARAFRDQALEYWNRQEAEREREERLAQLEARIEERETRGPGSPLDQRLERIEGLFIQQHEERQQQEYAQAEGKRVADSHVMALGQLVQLGQARGIEPPSPEDVEAFYKQSGAIRLEPNEAARYAWERLVGPELFGPRRGANLPYHPSRNPAGAVVIPGAAAPTASAERTVDNLIAEADMDASDPNAAWRRGD